MADTMRIVAAFGTLPRSASHKVSARCTASPMGRSPPAANAHPIERLADFVRCEIDRGNCLRLLAHGLEPRYFPEWAFFNVIDDRERKGCERCLSGVATVPLEPIGKQLERWVIAALLFASSASAALGLGCGTTPPLGRVIGRDDVEGETAVAAIYRFAHRNDICVGLALDDNALLPPL